MLGTCNLAETTEAKEDEKHKGGIDDTEHEFIVNQAFIEEDLMAEESDSKDESDVINDNGPTLTLSNRQKHLLNSYISNYAKEKLVRILNGQLLILQQRWGIEKILKTLVHYRKDKYLQSTYCQFKKFSY